MNNEMAKSKSQHLTYKLIPSSSIHHSCLSRAMAINHKNTLLLVQTEYYIKCYFFKGGDIKLFQLFYFRTECNILKFQQQKQDLIIGSNGYISRFSSNLLVNPKCIQKYLGPNNILCLILHPLKDDIIISGSLQGSINFLFSHRIGHNQAFQQTIQEHTKVCELSINDTGSIVISCGKDPFILIIQPSQPDSDTSKQIWIVKQKIIVDSFGYRICFINDNSFVFQPQGVFSLCLYIQTNGIFIKNSQQNLLSHQQYQLCLFSQMYNRQKSLLFNLFGRRLYIIKVSIDTSTNFYQSDQLFELLQEIDFGQVYNPWIFGIVSNDAEYIITWDFATENIQIRKFYGME